MWYLAEKGGIQDLLWRDLESWKAETRQGGSEVEALAAVRESLKDVRIRDSYGSLTRSPGVEMARSRVATGLSLNLPSPSCFPAE